MHISIIGSGNVAWHLAKAFLQAGHTIDAIACRNPQHAADIVQFSHSSYSTIDNVPIDSDIYIIAVSDASILNVAQQMPNVSGAVYHTSGASSMDQLTGFKHYGVFYPCQTFSKGDIIDYAKMPFFIEGNDEYASHQADSLARSISSNVQFATGIQRTQLHIAAVIASNFTNHMLHLAKKQMESNGLDFNMLQPLVSQTMAKAFSSTPFDAQTGPARRHDTNTIERHKLLIEDINTRNIYNIITDSIEKTY